MIGLLDSIGNFAAGVGKGIANAASSAWQGAKAMAEAGRQLATEPSAREQAWETVKQLAERAKNYANQAYEDPAMAYRDAKDGANRLYSEFDEARKAAASEGASAEFWGEAAGQAAFEIGSALIPIGAASKASKLAKAAKGLGTIEDAAGIATAAQRAERVAAAAAKLPATPAARGCPLLQAVGQAEQTAAQTLLKKAAIAEKQVTPLLDDLAKTNSAKLEGLDFRLKTEDSLARKLVDTPAEQIADALRYTMVSDSKDLAATAANTLSDLESKGYKVLKVKNTFKNGAPYKGINTQIMAPDGQVFELQFHTPQSLDVKQNLTHALYEEQRLLPSDSPRAQEIAREFVRISDAIPNPPGVQDALSRFIPK